MSEPQMVTPDPALLMRSRTSFARRMRRVAAVFDIIASICLLVAAALALLLAALAFNGQSDWVRVPVVAISFVVALGFGFTALLISRYQGLGLGWLGIGMGLVLVNAPLLLALLASWLHFPLTTRLMMTISQVWPGLGIYLLVIAVVHLVIANIYFIVHNRQLAAEQLNRGGTVEQGSPKPAVSFVPRCWEMYACPEAVRAKCPNFIDRVTCWKRRRGCLCDHKLSMYLFHGPNQETVRLANPQRLDVAVLSELETYPAKLREATPRSWRERRPFCHNCSIFLEHQGYKYKRMNWTFLPISLVVIAIFFPYFHLGYNFLAGWLDRLARHLALTGSVPENFYGNAGNLVGSPFEYLLMAVFGLLLMSYVVEFTDWCLLEWKI